jgi:thioredoxin-dependent peroxiredoxin
MLRAGDPAPDFAGTTAAGRPISLGEFRGRRLILYFFPKAGTPGCTAETRGFSEHYEEFARAGAEVVGISADSGPVQAKFSDRCGAQFPFVADADKSIARRYEVLGLLGLARRTTFLIDARGRIEEIIRGPFPRPHVRRALARYSGPLRGTSEPGPAFERESPRRGDSRGPE